MIFLVCRLSGRFGSAFILALPMPNISCSLIITALQTFRHQRRLTVFTAFHGYSIAGNCVVTRVPAAVAGNSGNIRRSWSNGDDQSRLASYDPLDCQPLDLLPPPDSRVTGAP